MWMCSLKNPQILILKCQRYYSKSLPENLKSCNHMLAYLFIQKIAFPRLTVWENHVFLALCWEGQGKECNHLVGILRISFYKPCSNSSHRQHNHITFLRLLLLLLITGRCICLHVDIVRCMQGPWSSGFSELLELQLQTRVSNLTWVLYSELRSPRREASPVNHSSLRLKLPLVSTVYFCAVQPEPRKAQRGTLKSC